MNSNAMMCWACQLWKCTVPLIGCILQIYVCPGSSNDMCQACLRCNVDLQYQVPSARVPSRASSSSGAAEHTGGPRSSVNDDEFLEDCSEAFPPPPLAVPLPVVLPPPPPRPASGLRLAAPDTDLTLTLRLPALENCAALVTTTIPNVSNRQAILTPSPPRTLLGPVTRVGHVCVVAIVCL